MVLIVGVVLVVGWLVPIEREHCDVSKPGETLRVSSSWSIGFFDSGFLGLFANNNTSTCVRNSLPREALAAVGIWSLPSPRAQVEDLLANSVENYPGGAEFVHQFFALQASAKTEANKLAAKFRSATTPLDYRNALIRFSAEMRIYNRRLKALKPPPPDAATVQQGLALDENVLRASNGLIAAIDSESRAQAAIAYRDFVASLSRYQRFEVSGLPSLR